MKKLKRCSWVSDKDPLMAAYHDTEWGVPLHDDRKIFEFLVLESFQAGLSWRTILNKRKNFEQAFADFSVKKVSSFGARDIRRLMADVGIVRNRAKIEAAINNARQFIKVQKEFGSFALYMWNFVGNKPIRNIIKTQKDYQSTSPEAETWARDLKKRGFKFLGPTVVYAHMQAVGMVNDHMVGCSKRRTFTQLPNRKK